MAEAAYKQGLIKSPGIKRVIDVDEAHKGMEKGEVFWGTNAVYVSRRGHELLGWQPSARSLAEDIPDTVAYEAPSK